MEPNTDEFIFEDQRLQQHSFNRMNKDFKQISFDLFFIAVAQFSGPIATMRDKSIPTQLSLPEELEDNVVIFSQKGKILKKIPFSTAQKVLAFAFTHDEILVIALNSGSYYMADPFRSSSFKEYKLGQSFTSQNILSCKTINSKLYYLLTNKRIYEVKNIHQPVAKQIILLSIKTENPVHYINIDQHGTEVTYLHESNEIYTWSNNEKAVDCGFLNDKKGGKLVHINRKVINGQVFILLVFHSPFRIWISKGDISSFYEVGLKAEDGEMKRSKGRGPNWKEVSYHVGWIGQMVVLSNNYWVVLIMMNGFKILRSEPGRICTEIDAVRIYADSNWILRLVPQNYSNLFSNGKDESLLQLYGAFESYQRGEVISKELLQSQRSNISMQLNKIIQGACYSLQPLEQMRILKFAIFVKTYYCLNINLKEICDQLRFVNNLKCEYLHRSLTLKEFQYLKENDMERLTNILIRYNLHYLAEIVGGGEKVYVHWAKCKIQKLNEDMALNEIVSKFKSFQEKEHKLLSYIDIARYAMETGRFSLAQNLIEKQPNVEKKVTILLWMAVVKKDDRAFLERAVDNAEKSLNSDIIFKVVREINKLPSDEKLAKMIEKNPLIKKHYIEYLQLKNVDKLREYYFKNKSSAQLGYLAIKQGLRKKPSEESQQMIGKLLPVVSEAIANRKPNQYANFLRKIKPKGALVSDAEIDRFKDQGNLEYLAEILIQKELIEQAVKVLYRVQSNNAYRFLEQMGKWKESATLAKERKDLNKLKELLEQAPDDNQVFINQLITSLTERR